MSLEQGALLRDEGHATVTQSADEDFKQRAQVAYMEAACAFDEFTSDDLVFRRDGHANYIGALMRKMALAGLAEDTGRVRKTQRTAGHARKLTIWRSLVR